MAAVEPDDGMEELLQYVKESRGFDFTGYKRASLTRRIQKRMATAGADGYAAYQEMLEAEPDEFVELFNTILINVTGFLRDPESWAYFAEDIIPRIVEGKEEDETIRVWSAGCASGEEPYSLAVLMCDIVGEDRFRRSVKIYGTDADNEALVQARHARYPIKALNSAFTEEQVSRYFEMEDLAMVFRKDLRRSVIFGRHDLVQDPPISRVDLLVCRNTLMYFNAEVQRRILGSFHFALNDGGYLFLGKSEAMVTRTSLFSVVDARRHVFEKRPGERPRRPIPPMNAGPFASRRSDTTELLENTFESGTVAQIVVNRDGDLVLANRHARTMFGLGISQIGRPLKDLELSYRPMDLRSRIEQVASDRRPVNVNDVEVDVANGGTEFLDVQFLPIGSEVSPAVLVTFVEIGRFKLLREELERSQRELETAYEELQSTVEELETTNEELQSTNEELETTNEELHSTNEELETMNEELQSTNEELETINNELRIRTTQLDAVNSFLKSILGSLTSGVAVLNMDMGIRIWNRGAEDLWGLRADEVEGHHFLNLDIGLPVEQLSTVIRTVLNGQSISNQVTLDAVNRRGRAIQCLVTVSPLNAESDEIEGVIVLMEQAAA